MLKKDYLKYPNPGKLVSSHLWPMLQEQRDTQVRLPSLILPELLKIYIFFGGLLVPEQFISCIGQKRHFSCTVFLTYEIFLWGKKNKTKPNTVAIVFQILFENNMLHLSLLPCYIKVVNSAGDKTHQSNRCSRIEGRFS